MWEMQKWDNLQKNESFSFWYNQNVCLEKQCQTKPCQTQQFIRHS